MSEESREREREQRELVGKSWKELDVFKKNKINCGWECGMR